MVGFSHRQSPLTVRSQVALNALQAERLAMRLSERGVGEVVTLSTCNRTEVYFWDGDIETVYAEFCEVAKIAPDEFLEYRQTMDGMGVACHLFRVASGLDSAVLGETEIVQQVKDAWASAQRQGHSGSRMDSLFQHGLVTSKRVRSETEISRNVLSTAVLAIREAEARVGSLKSATTVILGAGQIAARVARELGAVDAGNILVLNRTETKALAISELCGARHGSLLDLGDALLVADVVIGALAAPEPALSREVLEAAMAARSGKPLLILDMGVPSNVTTGLVVDGVTVVDIDALSKLAEENFERRYSALPQAFEVLSEELRKFHGILLKRAAGPTIKALVDQAEEVRVQNIEWARRQYPNMSPEQWELLETLSRRLVKGILETPIEQLNGGLAARQHRDLVAQLFGLDATEAVVDAP
jgi:glutamyl-tRNA reductase